MPMLNVIIPVYKARETLSDTLNSLCAQTNHRFITTVVVDCDNEDYTAIHEKYSHLLALRWIERDVNGGPGAARQTGLDANATSYPMCDYVMFVDADDMLLPRAVDVLYNEAKKNFADIVSANIMCEDEGKTINVLDASIYLTWCHAKIYRAAFLQENNIRFLDQLRANEDCYFNLVAHLLTTKKYGIDESLYLWRKNPNSITRSGTGNFHIDHNPEYLYSQVMAARRIGKAKTFYRLGPTFCNIYRAYELEFLYHKDTIEKANELVSNLFAMPEVYAMFGNTTFLTQVVNCCKESDILDEEFIFFPHSFYSWCKMFGLDINVVKEECKNEISDSNS
jgi:glycosyltransferase involved in cell wall biosynthesis